MPVLAGATASSIISQKQLGLRRKERASWKSFYLGCQVCQGTLFQKWPPLLIFEQFFSARIQPLSEKKYIFKMFTLI